MGAIVNDYSSAEAAVLALEAGGHISDARRLSKCVSGGFRCSAKWPDIGRVN